MKKILILLLLSSLIFSCSIADLTDTMEETDLVKILNLSSNGFSISRDNKGFYGSETFSDITQQIWFQQFYDGNNEDVIDTGTYSVIPYDRTTTFHKNEMMVMMYMSQENNSASYISTSGSITILKVGSEYRFEFIDVLLKSSISDSSNELSEPIIINGYKIMSLGNHD